MSDVRAISIKEYQYDLPEDRIAKYPLEKRDASKLLYYSGASIEDKIFHQLPELLHRDDLLVFNDTKVIRARIFFPRATGSIIEIFCLEPADELDPVLALQKRGSARWKVMIGNAKRWKDEFLEQRLNVSGEDISLKAFKEEVSNDHFIVRFDWPEHLTFSEVLEAVGQLPIPPYLNRETEEADLLRYQTVYARYDGSVAAPTAGLHFTEKTFDDLLKKGVQTATVTLHVGAGTFRPVKSENMAGHTMHEEKIYVIRETIEKLLYHSTHGRIITVGTTSMRTVESIYWFGVQLLTNGNETFHMEQWSPYELPQNITAADSFRAVLDHLSKHGRNVLSGSTALLIAPGYTFHAISGLITNFHQPGSTLILLVAAFIGENWKKVYEHALKNGYRFLSYGDSSLLTKQFSK